LLLFSDSFYSTAQIQRKSEKIQALGDFSKKRIGKIPNAALKVERFTFFFLTIAIETEPKTG
jgi:hypothetical protein